MSIWKIDETKIGDGKGGWRVVRPGDTVKLLPLELREKIGDGYGAQWHQDFMRRFLEGEGPYTISWIGRWPCGKPMIYLALHSGREPGVHASEFM